MYIRAEMGVTRGLYKFAHYFDNKENIKSHELCSCMRLLTRFSWQTTVFPQSRGRAIRLFLEFPAIYSYWHKDSVSRVCEVSALLSYKCVRSICLLGCRLKHVANVDESIPRV